MVGILTFHWADDCGAMLQAYALKTYLENQGETVEIIPYSPLRLRGRYQFVPFKGVCQEGEWRYGRDVRGFCWNLCFLKSFFRKRKSMRRFRKQYLTKKGSIETAGKICLRPYDIVVVGSDQVWNSALTFGLDDAYLGNLKRGHVCKMIAYGASFGKNRPPKKEWRAFRKALRENFAAVSLRERGAADFVGRLLNRTVTDVLDPVLLLEKDTWEAVAHRPREEKYILFYATEYQEGVLSLIERLSEVFHMPMVWLSSPYKWRQGKKVRLRMGLGPEAFVGYFRYASCIVTNSFHGLAFSVMFEKQFLVFRHSACHARLESLLEKLALSSRLVEMGKETDVFRMKETIRWQVVRECLRRERKRSEQFLKESMENV